MTESPRLDMHIYLRGKADPLLVPGIEADRAVRIRDDLTPEPGAAFPLAAAPWYDFTHRQRSHRVLRADVQLVSLAETYVNPARNEEPMPAVPETC